MKNFYIRNLDFYRLTLIFNTNIKINKTYITREEDDMLTKNQMLEALSKASIASLDFEYKIDGSFAMELFSVSCLSGKKAVGYSGLPDEFPEFWDILKDLELIFHNAKADFKVLSKLGIDVHSFKFQDTMVMAHLIDETRRKGLKDLRVSELGKPKREEWKDIDKTDILAYKAYSTEDAIDTLELYYKIKDLIAEEELETVYDLERATIYPILMMELSGVMIDKELLVYQDTYLRELIDEIEVDIKGKTQNQALNLRSTKQLQELFYANLRYPPLKHWKTKTGYSTGKEVLEHIAKDKQHKQAAEIASGIVKHRKYTKLHGSFIVNLADRVMPDGRVYGNFNSVGTATGRFSANDPNLQQVPRKAFAFEMDDQGNLILDDEGSKVEDLATHLRSLFIAPPGKKLLTLDFSQIELRMMALLSSDPEMCQVFLDDGDLHQKTADLIGCARDHAKSLNFGVGYGMGPSAFAGLTGLSFNAANHYIQMFWQKYSGVDSFFNEIREAVKKCGYVRTIAGRKRRFFTIDDMAMRQAQNAIIQGSSADLMKAALINIYSKLDKTRGKLIMTVHDEVTTEVDDGYVEECMEMQVDCMANTLFTSVPILAAGGYSDRWSLNK